MRLTKDITNIKHDDSWRVTTMQFIIHFKEQVCLLDSLVTPEAKLPDTARLTFLQTAVDSVPHLHHVQRVDGPNHRLLCLCPMMSILSYYMMLHFTMTGPLRPPTSPGKHMFMLLNLLNLHSFMKWTPPYEIFINTIKPPVLKELVKVFLNETLWKQISDVDRKLIIDYNRKISSGNQLLHLHPLIRK